eukprot:10798203-Ditylum_brightwellii.AAC.1
MKGILEKEQLAVGKKSLYLAKIYLDMCTVYSKLGNRHEMLRLLKFSSQILEERQVPENHPLVLQKRALQVKAENMENEMKYMSPLASAIHTRA